MLYKLKALGVGALCMSVITSGAVMINVIIALLGTDLFMISAGVLAGLGFCYIFGDLILSVYGSKVKSDA